MLKNTAMEIIVMERFRMYKNVIKMVKLAFLGNESSRSEVEYDCTRCNFTQLLRGFKTKENHTST